MTKLLAYRALTILGLVTAVALSGCTLYFGEDTQSNYCPPGTYVGEDQWGNEACLPGGPIGFDCTTDNQCASGCYCDEASGSCAEAGYCSVDTDCGYGFECDCSNSCVPAGTESRTCGVECSVTGCPAGTTCAADGSCIPQGPSCTDDTQCAAGCYCLNGTCEETNICSTDADCPTEEFCDTTRATCMPDPIIPPGGPSCAGEITCAFGAPSCPAGWVPTIQDGCWTGQCADLLLGCDTAPSCGVINTEGLCLDRGDCGAVYSGQNCTNPSGATCSMGDSGCTCETFTFDRCVAD